MSILLGLFIVLPVPAIDGDYSNPYATGPQGSVDNTQLNGPPVWNGVAAYGGRDRKLPPMTLVGAGLLLLGIGTGGYALIRERRRYTPAQEDL